MNEEERAEAFREYHAEHLRRQTSAIESIRTMVQVWFILTLVGIGLFMVIAATQNSGL